ncbi:hypothetical protein NC653_030143 [Populus alba x Populus x berolinensis]|uniref:Uncharacterized protein n=1 Tax=Populus alba x Populus x berolinensis TaxID=444605 RepID=A0AAD6LVP1_9ROSI|nr:hypothetical protein NC653_030143 [Populus alba x Populus x berolinensis]
MKDERFPMGNRVDKRIVLICPKGGSLNYLMLRITMPNNLQGVNFETYFVLARWKLRTYLKFPWRPLISIDGSTVYELDNKLKIVRHAESWNVSALEAIGQIFTPSFDRPGE